MHFDIHLRNVMEIFRILHIHYTSNYNQNLTGVDFFTQGAEFGHLVLALHSPALTMEAVAIRNKERALNIS